MNILIADDDPDMLRILTLYFQKEGFTVYTALDGEEALNICFAHKIDLAVLDWMMPRVSGIRVCGEIKKRHAAKVLMLTAKSGSEDEWNALLTGADDYVRKPFEPKILLLRAKKLIRAERDIYIGGLRVDMEGGKIFRGETDLGAANKEFLLLKCLLEHKGKILSRETLLDHVWGFDYDGEERTVDTHIRRLRERIGGGLIKTHRGMGYSLEEPREPRELQEPQEPTRELAGRKEQEKGHGVHE
ncbi:response regulator transcription factor [Paenibacillus chitinolyticus]|uniref:response regulator transcription factor n=1 Tax=Paenibacillus chitinolyticus TaxID=79263 RepID=UPI001C475C0A|nr:response regulator transcription factor [Paenibacillus chitinolyticus]MBV6715086.1 response regulator transcription factor [Paenibacillus chitinolyticus]